MHRSGTCLQRFRRPADPLPPVREVADHTGVGAIVTRYIRPMGSVTRLPTAIADRLAKLPYSYPEVGATKQDRLPHRYRDLCLHVDAGSGWDRFTRLADQLMHWQLHAASGLDVATSRDPAVPGAGVVATYRFGPVPIRTRCRVLYVIDDHTCRGFAYGTLPGHPLRGEERFVLRLRDDGTVTFTVRSFSRPAGFFARLGGPVTWRVQQGINRGYLDAARRS